MRPPALCLLGVIALCIGCFPFSAAQVTARYDTNPAIFTVDDNVNIACIFTQDASLSAGLTAFTVSPNLPSGLSLAPSTGLISGTVTTATAATVYTITVRCQYLGYVDTLNPGPATGNAVCAVLPLTITVLPKSPSISLVAAERTITKNVAVSFQPAVAARATSFSISPPLPAGLLLNTTTGNISGTATVTVSSATYAITATNSAGSASAQFTLTVQDPSDPPGRLDSRIDGVQTDTKTAIAVAVIAIAVVFAASVLGAMTFIAWRARKETSAPPVIISDQAVEKLGRMMNPVTLQSLMPAINKFTEKHKDRAEMSTGGGSAMDFPFRARGGGNLASRYAGAGRREAQSEGVPTQRKPKPAAAATIAGSSTKQLTDLVRALEIPEHDVQRLLDEGLELDELLWVKEEELRERCDTSDAAMKLWSYIRQQREQQASK